MTAAVSATQWAIGWTVAGAVVLVVVLLVGTVIVLAARIRTQLLAIHAALVETRDETAALWAVETTNHVAGEILAAAREARAALGG